MRLTASRAAVGGAAQQQGRGRAAAGVHGVHDEHLPAVVASRNLRPRAAARAGAADARTRGCAPTQEWQQPHGRAAWQQGRVAAVPRGPCQTAAQLRPWGGRRWGGGGPPRRAAAAALAEQTAGRGVGLHTLKHPPSAIFSSLEAGPDLGATPRRARMSTCATPSAPAPPPATPLHCQLMHHDWQAVTACNRAGPLQASAQRLCSNRSAAQ